MCVFSFGSRCADFGRYVIDRQNALHRIFWSKTSFSFRTVASSHCAIHRLRRSLAALLLSLPLLLGLAVSAQAQVLISNIGQTGAGDANGLLTAARTQDFTTGSHVKGYTVRSLDIVFRKNNLPDLFRKNNPRLTVTIRNASGNNPGTTVVGRLNLPASSPTFSSDRTITFTAPAKGIKLSPSTKYFVVIELDASRSIGTGASLRLINSDAENTGGAAGFSIGNRDAVYTWWSDPPIWGTGPTSFQMSVKGVPNPITDLIQMSKATRKVAEFGNHKANGGIRVVVDIGDGLTPQGSPRTINYTVGGTAVRGDGEDYTIDGCTSSTCTVRLPANRHSAIITIYVNNEDDLDENDETIIITLQDGTGYTVNNAKKTTTVTINDDDTRGLTFHRTWPDVQEGDSVTYTVKLASQPTAAVTVNIASNNQDVTTTPTSLTFNPSGSNLWSTARTVTIDAAQDDDAVDDEAILTHTTSGGDYGGANALSIDRPVSVDDDETAAPITSNLPRISLDGGSAVTEGAAASFTVNAAPAPTARLTVNVEVIEPPGQDFVAASEERVRTVTLNAGATSATFTVPTVNDSTDEADGVVQVYVNDGTGYIADQGAVVNVNDNDGTGPPTTPAASFASASSSAAENAGTHNVTVDISPAPSSALTLGYSVSGTATAGSGNDFTIQNSGSLSVAAGATSVTIPVAIIDDSATENAETVILTLSGGTGYTVGNPSVYTLTITDNDGTTPKTPFLTLNPTEIGARSLDGATITLTPVNASFFGASGSGDGGNGGESNVDPRTYVNSNDLVSNNIPHSAVRLSALGLGKITLSGAPAGLTIASGRLLARQSQQGGFVHGLAAHRSVEITLAYSGSLIGADDPVTVNVDGDALRLVDGNSRQDLSDISADFTVKAGAVPPAASFASVSSSVGENAGTRNVTVNLSAPAPSGGLTLGYSVSGTATSGSGNDFTIQGSGSLTIAARTTSATIPVAINDDNAAENAETVILTLTGGSGYRLGSPRVHTLTITDNDSTSAQPSVSFKSASSSEAESAGTRNVTVTISPAPSSGFTLSYGVSGTATAGNDFTDQGSGTVAVAAEATSVSIPVAINDDSVTESDETVILTLTGGAGYTLGTATVHTLTITNDDGHEVSFTAAEDRIPEGREHTVAVRIFPVSDNLTNVSYTISGTATAEEDFEDLPVMVEVPAGESQAVIRIETIADKEDDSGETVILTLQSDMSQELSLGSPSVHTLTILDSKEAIVEAGRSWLVRFGRSVAEQVVDSIGQRLRATRIEGTQVSVAGAQVPIGQSRAFGTFEPPTNNRPIDDFDTHSQTAAPGSTQTLSEREVIQSSSFMSVSESDAQGGSFAVWGRAAHSSFEGRDKDLSLDGDSTSVMLGADYAQQYWQAGATLIQSEGKGEYRDEVISGDAEASITSIVPWAAVQATERVQLWGALGTGDGDLELTEEDSDTLKTNIDWSMAAAGLRSVLVPASGQNGLQLSLVGDALWVETKADPIEGLSIADAQASRLRIGLEGEYASELASEAEMISRLELGVREDSGDAETGGGIEIGGGIAWRDASSGLKIELAGRKLLTYDADELEDEGFSLSFDYDPAPNTEEGLSVSLHQEIGVRSKGGLEALFDSEPLATRTDGEKENRVRLEAGYGVPVLGGRFIGSPHMGLGLVTGSREYSLGWKVTPERHAPDLSFGVRATRTESDALVPAHAIRFETVFRW